MNRKYRPGFSFSLNKSSNKLKINNADFINGIKTESIIEENNEETFSCFAMILILNIISLGRIKRNPQKFRKFSNYLQNNI